MCSCMIKTSSLLSRKSVIFENRRNLRKFSENVRKGLSDLHKTFENNIAKRYCSEKNVVLLIKIKYNEKLTFQSAKDLQL